jgi:hypothetical protein
MHDLNIKKGRHYRRLVLSLLLAGCGTSEDGATLGVGYVSWSSPSATAPLRGEATTEASLASPKDVVATQMALLAANRDEAFRNTHHRADS